jgi:hypothetical protein
MQYNLRHRSGMRQWRLRLELRQRTDGLWPDLRRSQDLGEQLRRLLQGLPERSDVRERRMYHHMRSRHYQLQWQLRQPFQR